MLFAENTCRLSITYNWCMTDHEIPECEEKLTCQTVFEEEDNT